MNQYNYTPYQFGSLACGDWSPGSPSRKINGVITGFFAVIDDSIVALFVLYEIALLGADSSRVMKERDKASNATILSFAVLSKVLTQGS